MNCATQARARISPSGTPARLRPLAGPATGVAADSRSVGSGITASFRRTASADARPSRAPGDGRPLSGPPAPWQSYMTHVCHKTCLTYAVCVISATEAAARRRSPDAPSFLDSTWYLLARAGSLAYQRWAAMIAAFEVSPTQYKVLMTLGEGHAVCQQRLAELIDVDPR